MAMAARQPRSPRPLNPAKLEEMALSYVGRFATSRAKLTSYLRRKLRERGWDGQSDPAPDALAERLAGLGYVDDRAFAVAKARSLTGRGYGERRVRQALTIAGIGEEEGAPALELAGAEAAEAALRFARRRSIGPYAGERADPKQRERMLASMIRAGHRFGIARAIIDMAPGETPDLESLRDLV
jgi:regulatory protein